MASTLHHEHVFPCDATTLLELLMDDDFDLELCKHLDITYDILEKSERENGEIFYRYHMKPARELPGFIRKLSGATNSFVEKRTWNRAFGGNHWEIEPGFAAGRVSVSGTFRIHPVDAHSCRRVVEGQFEVKVPLVGRKIEGFLIKQSEDSFTRGAAFIEQWLATHT